MIYKDISCSGRVYVFENIPVDKNGWGMVKFVKSLQDVGRGIAIL